MGVKKKVIEILKGLSGKNEIKESDRLQDDIGLDSLGMVMLLVEIEDTFLIELNEADMNPFDLSTVSDILELISKYSEVSYGKES